MNRLLTQTQLTRESPTECLETMFPLLSRGVPRARSSCVSQTPFQQSLDTRRKRFCYFWVSSEHKSSVNKSAAGRFNVLQSVEALGLSARFERFSATTSVSSFLDEAVPRATTMWFRRAFVLGPRLRLGHIFVLFKHKGSANTPDSIAE